MGDNGKPLGDRELMLAKKKQQQRELAVPEEDDDLLEDEPGLFDRFSTSRKSISKSAGRRGNEDTMSLNDLNLEKKKGDWRSRLASKFKKASDYDLDDGSSSRKVTRKKHCCHDKAATFLFL